MTQTDTDAATTAPVGGAADPLIELTAAALDTVLAIRSEEGDPAGLCLRIEITGSKGVDFIYDLAFDELGSRADDDVVVEIDVVDGDPLSVLVPAATVDRLQGSVLDLPRDDGQGGLVIRNPNRPDPLAGVELHLEGSVADRVAQVLDQSVNPSLASHGGFATLVGVDDDHRVYITMGGGCHGCAMSRMTLTQGIDRSIREAVPEVIEVVDATDHTVGQNPFYS